VNPSNDNRAVRPEGLASILGGVGQPGQVRQPRIDTAEAARFLQLIGRDTGPLVLTSFPGIGRNIPGCAGPQLWREVEQESKRHPTRGIGFKVCTPLPQPADWGSKPGHRNTYGGIKKWGASSAHMAGSNLLCAEADGGLSQEEQLALPARAGLPEPTITVFSGGKSVHFFWLLDKSRDESPLLSPERFGALQKRIALAIEAVAPEAKADQSLGDAGQVMRLPGSIHPVKGERCRILSSNGPALTQEVLAQLELSLPPIEDKSRDKSLNKSRDKSRSGEGFKPSSSGGAKGSGWFSRLSPAEQEAHAIEMLQVVPRRGEPGSGTYPEAFSILCALIHHFGEDKAVELARTSGWEGQHWDVEAKAYGIGEHPGQAGIGTLIATARAHGWTLPIRPRLRGRFAAGAKTLQQLESGDFSSIKREEQPDVLATSREGATSVLPPAPTALEQLLAAREVVALDRHLKGSDIPAPEKAKLVALLLPMGGNKTGAMAELARAGTPMVSLTHRRSLADQQGARLGLPVLREGAVLSNGDTAPDATSSEALEQQLARHQGCVVVLDSSGPSGSCHLRPEDCAGKTLFIDEADAFLQHALGSNTEIAKQRVEVLQNFRLCVAASDQVVIASAHLDATTITAFEAMVGWPAVVITSTIQPAAGRQLNVLATDDQVLAVLVNRLCAERAPFLVHTTSAKESSTFAPAALSRLIRKAWPEARVLEVTAATIHEAEHPASSAVKQPELLLNYDAVLTSPAVETGVSIEDPEEHFKAVVVVASTGHVSPQALVQSTGRLRSNVPRYLYCPTSGAKQGNGATTKQLCLDGYQKHSRELKTLYLDLALASQARMCRFHGLDPTPDPLPDATPFMEWWCELTAERNTQAARYRARVLDLMAAEGYTITAAAPSNEGKALKQALKQHRDEVLETWCSEVASAPLLEPEALEKLDKAKQKTRRDTQILERNLITKKLGIQTPSAEQVAAKQEDARGKILRWQLVNDPEAYALWVQRKLRSVSASTQAFAPDTAKHFRDGYIAQSLKEAISTAPSEAAAQLELLLALMGTTTAFSPGSFRTLWKWAKARPHEWRLTYGFCPDTGTPRTFLAGLARLFGFELEQVARQQVAGKREYTYRLTDSLACLDRPAVEAHLKAELKAERSDAHQLEALSATVRQPQPLFTAEELNASMAEALACWDAPPPAGSGENSLIKREEQPDVFATSPKMATPCSSQLAEAVA
jgi:hypothetical protein